MSEEQGLTPAQRREQFRADWAEGLAEQAAGGPVGEFTSREAGTGLSGRLCWFSAPGRLVVVAGAHLSARDVDLALAFGLYHVKADQTLVLVIPHDEKASRATLVRAPWIDRPLEVWTYGPDLVEGVVPAASRVPLDSRERVLERYTVEGRWGYGHTPPPPDDYRDILGDRAEWIESLASWLAEHPDIDAEHRKTYAAWKCAGKIVLKAQRARGGLDLGAGIQYSKPTKAQKAPVKETCSGPLSAEQLSTLKAAVEGGVDEMLGGMGGLYLEHRLQAAISRQPKPILELASKPVAEYPAWRPYVKPRGRAFVDFLGVDAKGTLHVLETKVGGDVMMVLQGLDYWIWATANWGELSAQFRLDDQPKVEVDFLISQKHADEWLGPYSEAQSRALAPEVIHRFWKISDWDLGATAVILPLGG